MADLSFRYEARDREGILCKGDLDAQNLRAATRTLQERGLTVLQIRWVAKCRCGCPAPPHGTACEECGRVAPNAGLAGLKLVALLAALAILGRLLGLY